MAEPGKTASEVDEALVRSLAETVRVALSDEQVAELTGYFREVLGYFQQLGAVDTASVDAAAPPADAADLAADALAPSLVRADLAALGGGAFDEETGLFRLQGVFENVER